MLYMVECGFSDPMREAEWSAWYSGPKLTKVLKVPGFLCSQRFESIVPAPAPYLAIHAVSSGEVFGTSYRGLGGGSFNEWQPYISNWRRTLFSGLDVAPEITPDDFLLVIDGRPANFDNLGIPLSWLETAGLDGSVPWRAIASINEVQAGQLRNQIGSSLRIFRPLTRQLQRAA